MPTMNVNLIKGDKVSSKTDYRDNLPVNMYAVERPILGAVGYMLCYPGLTKITDGSGVDRGAFYNDRQKNLFRVSGTKLIDVSDDGVKTELGSISGSGQAAMDYSFNTQCVIADGKMFLYDGSTFSEVTDSDLGNPIDVVWVDGYYFLTDGEYIYHTNITDESQIDPLKFATAEFMPDESLGLAKTQDDKVIVFGRYSTQYFDNAATENFAFKWLKNRGQNIGIVATHAKTETIGKWYITGGRREESLGVHAITLGGAKKVSTREIDKILGEYTEPELSDMRMESRVEDGTAFVIIHLPNEVLCFNETIAQKFGIGLAWTILKSDVVGDAPYRGINAVFDARTGQWNVGDKANSNIGYIDDEVCTQYGNIVEWLLYTPFIKLETLSIDELEVETIPGHTAAEDATVAISLTYDGVTYGTEWFNLYGLPSDYSQRFMIWRLGYVGDWVGIKLRGASSSRMAFGAMRLQVG